jgi:hypothetical protein
MEEHNLNIVLIDVLPKPLEEKIGEYGFVMLIDVMPRMVEKGKFPDQVIAGGIFGYII